MRRLDELERLEEKLRFRESEAVDAINLWWMACKTVGIPWDSSGGAFRDAIVTLKHKPKQPVIMVDGQPRFQQNAIVRYLLDHGGITLNDIARHPFSDEDTRQFMQLIGYSLDGYAELFGDES